LQTTLRGEQHAPERRHAEEASFQEVMLGWGMAWWITWSGAPWSGMWECGNTLEYTGARCVLATKRHRPLRDV